MLGTICRFTHKRQYRRFIKNQEKVKAYMSNLGTWETRLNDESRMLINSIKGSVNAEKYINKAGKVNVTGFMNHVKQRHHKFYNSQTFKQYNKQVIHLQGKIRYEKEVINKYTRFFNEYVQRHPFLAKVWNFELLPYNIWNEGRNVKSVSKEYNELNKAQF